MSLAHGHVRAPRGTAIEKLEGYEEGAWWEQDLAANIPAGDIGYTQGQALDLCAAPGGKTMALAARGWQVTALDMSKRRLDALKQNLKRTGLKASPVRADALKWEPSRGGQLFPHLYRPLRLADLAWVRPFRDGALPEGIE